MEAFQFFMPAHVYFGKDCIIKNQEALRGIGSKALIVTGKNSAKKNGSQKDIITALEAVGKKWVVFDEIEENPSLETVAKGAQFGVEQGVDFVVGIGGGSPMDSAKAIACLIANPGQEANCLFGAPLSHLPVVEIPTTAGTGSETTQYSIVTLHEKRTKASIPQTVFADISFLDAKYMDTLSPATTNNTAVDALTHLIEAYLSAKANFFSDQLVEMGLKLFCQCKEALKARKYDSEIREKLMLASTIGGMAIAQAGTSLPHALGYYLTYEKQIPHGRANGIVTQAYLELFPNRDKINVLLSLLDMSSIEEMGAFLKEVLDTMETFTAEDVAYYTKEVWKYQEKLKSYPYDLSIEDIQNLYAKSLLS